MGSNANSFHVNPATGVAGRCRSERGRCPFGGPGEHHPTEAAARAAYEQAHASRSLPPTVSRRRRAVVRVAAVFTATVSLAGCFPGGGLTPSESASSSTATPPSTPSSLPTASTSSTPTATPSSTATPSASSTASSGPSQGSSLSPQAEEALARLAGLSVNDSPPTAGYKRDSFLTSREWEAAKLSVYQRDFVDISYNARGQVERGVLLEDPYTGTTVVYQRGGAADVDVEHVVSLANGYASGMSERSREERHAFATDMDNLIAVSSGANRAKGKKEASKWLPPHEAYRCTYATSQVVVKERYTLTVTTEEKLALAEVIVEYC